MESAMCCSIPYAEGNKDCKRPPKFIRILNKIRILGAEDMSRTK